MEHLYQLTKEDLPRAAAVLQDAFKDDPVWRTALEGVPNADRRIAALYETPLRYCLKYGGVWAPTSALEGVAAWMLDEYSEMTVRRSIASGGFLAGFRIGIGFTLKMLPVFRRLEKDRLAHMAGKRYLYLQIMGVSTNKQGQGYGGQMLRALIDRCDQEGLYLYLETETPKNVDIYRRFGLEVIQRITLPRLELPMWEMARIPGR
jgi:GNAT superfamily N-acetyltransferase